MGRMAHCFFLYFFLQKPIDIYNIVCYIITIATSNYTLAHRHDGEEDLKCWM